MNDGGRSWWWEDKLIIRGTHSWNKHKASSFHGNVGKSEESLRAIIKQRRWLISPLLVFISLTTITPCDLRYKRFRCASSPVSVSSRSRFSQCSGETDAIWKWAIGFLQSPPMWRAVPLTAIHSQAIPLPPPNANKQTRSLPRSPPGGPSQHIEWSITQWWIKRKTVRPSLISSPPLLFSPALWCSVSHLASL